MCSQELDTEITDNIPYMLTKQDFLWEKQSISSTVQYFIADRPLPATVQKIVTEILPPSEGISFGKDARDLLIECCVEFITLISSEANEISEKEAKKTIACEHVTKALSQLGFGEYVPYIQEVASEHKETLKVCTSRLETYPWNVYGLACENRLTGSLQGREKKANKLEKSGLTTEQLLAMQEAELAEARSRHN